MTLGPLAFLNPWLLAGLAALPVIWWLLRTVPPRPQRVAFPPTRILKDLENKEKTPARTPWWLTAIRMAAAALVIVALAEPILNPKRTEALSGAGPVVVLVDNGWTSAARWGGRSRMVETIISEAEAQRRPVVVWSTASVSKSAVPRIESPGAARSTAAALQPQPFEPRRLEAIAPLEGLLRDQKDTSVVWLSDGVDHAGEGKAFLDRLVAIAASASAVTIVGPGNGEDALGLGASLSQGGKLEARIVRAEGGVRDGLVVALSARGQRLGEAVFRLGVGATSTTTLFEMPLELRNQVTRLEIAGERSAGAVQLLDARSQWHRIGVISGASREQSQPLLSPTYYVEKALAPFAELVLPKDSNVAQGIDLSIRQNSSVLVLADIGTLTGDLKTKVEQWVKKGGVLIRFAGPRLEKGGDEMLPVALRIGGRTLGGALSWSTPQPLSQFEADSLFAGLTVAPEVTVSRQVLADPARLGTDVKVWARLKDGTPLVTSRKFGDGELVLFHVTANSEWSNLPLSGLFVEMLQRLITLGRLGGAGGEATVADDKTSEAPAGAGEVLAPLQVLDGFGTLRQPPPTAQPIPQSKILDTRPSADNPPGYYGPAGAPRSLNLIGAKTVINVMPSPPLGVRQRLYEGETSKPLKAQLLATALGLLFADILAVLMLQGLGSLFRRSRPAVAALVAGLIVGGGALTGGSGDALAQAVADPRSADGFAIRSTSKVSFAYVVTGDATVDNTSRAGLAGLNRVLVQRTAVEPGEPIGVDILADEIAFFPVLYWPVLSSTQALSEKVLAKIDAYMKQGGMIIFDTRDHGTGIRSSQAGNPALTRLIGRLDVPRLEPVPDSHVLTRSFYLLKSFPGRWDGGQMWVEAGGDSPIDEQNKRARRVDGVSSILITSNDLAAAWAQDERGRALYPAVPGGEQQREMAYRVGVNIIMYALTGNYKADQVHVPALLDRLGQ